MLMACIPLVLCITLFSAFFLPGMMPEDSRASGSTEAAKGELTQDGCESLAVSIAKIEVSGFRYFQTYTDISDVLLICDQLYAYSTRVPEANGSANDGFTAEDEDRKENVDDISGSIADSANTGYTITLVMREGGKTEYYLAGNTLTNRTDNQTHTLSQKQVTELKDLLGIPS